MSKASKIVSSAIIGTDRENISVNNKLYVIKPPTIHKLSGCVSCISDFDIPDAPTVRDILLSLKNLRSCAEALSWLIDGDDSLTEELSHGSIEEVLNGIEKGLSLISTEVFLKAASLAKSVALLAAKAKL